MEAEQAAVQDFDLPLAWLSNGGDVPHDSALFLWNFAGDVARGIRMGWADRDPDQDTVYDKLFGASVPWFTDDESYAPEWSAQDLRLCDRL